MGSVDTGIYIFTLAIEQIFLQLRVISKYLNPEDASKELKDDGWKIE